ncbi:MAG TPA: TonB family protein [Bryobacteraceae bacterium]|jgi:TonB family protein|nr:TonB family protein [Bryobacteraceae bacterium]
MRSPLAISLAGHALAFIALMYAPTVQLPEPGKSEYKQAIEGKESKLVWYKLNKELPNVAAKAKSQRPVKAESLAKQEIVASPKKAPKRAQIVWTVAPELPPPPPVDLPNLLAVKLPPLRQFVAPPDIQKAPPAPVQPLPEAPLIPLQDAAPVALPPRSRMVKQFVPPPKRVPPKLAEVAMPSDAPQVALNAPAVDLDYKMKSPSRPFTAPPARPAQPVAAPQLVALNDAPDLNLAVVGLNPADKFVPQPILPSPGQFSAAPTIRKQGADVAGDSRGLTVPDLSIRGNKDLQAKLLAQAFAAPTGTANMRESMRLAKLTPPAAPMRTDPLPVSPRSTAMKVSGAPDARFNNRDVYMMAIQMPNLTSYSGSWLMWYADRTSREVGLAPVSPPVAHRKVDPKYVASAIADKVEGKIQLFCVVGKDGNVSGIEMVRGLDSRLNASAIEALGKWEFFPATREGEPVAVDVLVEIPFRLTPLNP